MKISAIFPQTVRASCLSQGLSGSGRVGTERAWEWQGLEQANSLQEARHCEHWVTQGPALQTPQGHSPTSHCIWKWCCEAHLVPPSPPLSTSGKGEDTRFSPRTVESWQSTDTLVRAQGKRILKRQTPSPTGSRLCEAPWLSAGKGSPSAPGKRSRKAGHRLAITWSWWVTSWRTGGTRRGRQWRPTSHWARTWWRGLALGSQTQRRSRQNTHSPGRRRGRWGCACKGDRGENLTPLV